MSQWVTQIYRKIGPLSLSWRVESWQNLLTHLLTLRTQNSESHLYESQSESLSHSIYRNMGLWAWACELSRDKKGWLLANWNSVSINILATVLPQHESQSESLSHPIYRKIGPLSLSRRVESWQKRVIACLIWIPVSQSAIWPRSLKLWVTIWVSESPNL